MRNAWLRRLLIVTQMQGSYSPCPDLKSYKNSLRTQQCIGGRLATKKLINYIQAVHFLLDIRSTHIHYIHSHLSCSSIHSACHTSKDILYFHNAYMFLFLLSLINSKDDQRPIHLYLHYQLQYHRHIV